MNATLSRARPRKASVCAEGPIEGQEFSAGSLGSLPPFLYSFAYWEPTPPVQRELEIFLEANRAQIKRDVEPVILQIAEKYLSLRP